MGFYKNTISYFYKHVRQTNIHTHLFKKMRFQSICLLSYLSYNQTVTNDFNCFPYHFHAMAIKVIVNHNFLFK